MKTKNYLFYACLVFTGVLNAQEDQTAKATKMGEGKFMSYVINYDNGNYTYAGINKEVWSLTVRPFHEKGNQIGTKEFETSRETMYYPDEDVFPVTYINGLPTAHKAMAGYEYINYSNDTRMVILDEWVYFLEKYKDKDNYVIKTVLKKGEKTGLKAMKAAMGAAKEMEAAKHKETLQKYLDEGFKKQAELLLTPEGKQKSDLAKAKNKAGEDRWTLVVDSINGGYWNSAEGKRVKAMNDKKSGQAKITLVNDLSVDLLLCHGQGVSTRLKPGEKREFNCSGDKVKKGKPRANNTTQFDATDVVLLTGDGSGCGNTVKASSVNK